MKSTSAAHSIRINEGDIFDIPAPDDRRGYGQVIVAGDVLYVVVFADLYLVQPDFHHLLNSDLLLVGWTLDGLIFHGEWTIVGNLPPIVARVPFPKYKVTVNGKAFVHDFDGSNYQRATAGDLDLFENKKTVAPIRYQKALLAHNGLDAWLPYYEDLTIQHARRRE